MRRPTPSFIRNELEQRQADGLLRRMRQVDGAQESWIEVDGRRVLSMCSNNYLGLANHPALREAAARAAHDLGVGAGASRLISGSMRLHHELEARLADLKQTERALLFSTGYHANIGAITALVGAEDAVFSDELNHASLIDGCRLSRARVEVYRHNDLEMLETKLRECHARRRLIVTDSIFSMDGDAAPLREICDLAERFDAMVFVDEAHATGVLGPHGAGLVAELGLQDRVTVQMGTLGKALGTFGAFVAGSSDVIEHLINAARSFVFTTALPPPVVASALAAVELAHGADDLRQRLRGNAEWMASRLGEMGIPVQPSHIVPIVIGDAGRTMAICEELLGRGVFAQGIRPPTVPRGTSRLRLTLMSSHSSDDLGGALAALRAVLAEAD